MKISKEKGGRIFEFDLDDYAYELSQKIDNEGMSSHGEIKVMMNAFAQLCDSETLKQLIVYGASIAYVGHNDIDFDESYAELIRIKSDSYIDMKEFQRELTNRYKAFNKRMIIRKRIESARGVSMFLMACIMSTTMIMLFSNYMHEWIIAMVLGVESLVLSCFYIMWRIYTNKYKPYERLNED